MRYIAKQITETSLYSHLAGTWEVVNSQTGTGLFGDHMPRDREEAEQCARAANIAAAEATYEMRNELTRLVRSFSR